MEKLNELQRDFIRVLMTGAGLLDHGNPLAYFTTYQTHPDVFNDVIQRKVTDPEIKQDLVNAWIDAYNQHATEQEFWHLVGDLEDVFDE